MSCIESAQGEGVLCTRHRYIEKAPRRIWILAPTHLMPGTIEYGNMIELQSLCSMRREQ
jgi:hypothetical protein